MEHGTEGITRLVIQLAVILAAAKVGGELFERFLKMPSVLGELATGIAIGPFALGGIDVPAVGPLFEDLVGTTEGFTIPVSEGLWAIAQVGSIVLLFAAGLATNLRQFLPLRPAGFGGRRWRSRAALRARRSRDRAPGVRRRLDRPEGALYRRGAHRHLHWDHG